MFSFMLISDLVFLKMSGFARCSEHFFVDVFEREFFFLKENPNLLFYNLINTFYLLTGNCSVIRNYLENAPDDEYVIRVHPKCNAVNVYCYNMTSIDQKTSALEFITLTRGAECNYAKYHKSRLIDYTTCSGKEDSDPEQTKNYWGQTWYVERFL